jgi:hypothetical protein
MVDHAANDGSRSPGLSPMLNIASPPDWSTLFSDIGLASLDMVPSNLEVSVVIPRHEPKRVSLPNDAALMDSFLGGLKLHRFDFYASNNRPISKDENFHMWHRRNPLETLQARLTEEFVQDIQRRKRIGSRDGEKRCRRRWMRSLCGWSSSESE